MPELLEQSTRTPEKPLHGRPIRRHESVILGGAREGPTRKVQSDLKEDINSGVDLIGRYVASESVQRSTGLLVTIAGSSDRCISFQAARRSPRNKSKKLRLNKAMQACVGLIAKELEEEIEGDTKRDAPFLPFSEL